MPIPEEDNWQRLYYKYSHIGCPACAYEDNCARPDECADNGRCKDLPPLPQSFNAKGE